APAELKRISQAGAAESVSDFLADYCFADSRLKHPSFAGDQFNLRPERKPGLGNSPQSDICCFPAFPWQVYDHRNLSRSHRLVLLIAGDAGQRLNYLKRFLAHPAL